MMNEVDLAPSWNELFRSTVTRYSLKNREDNLCSIALGWAIKMRYCETESYPQKVTDNMARKRTSVIPYLGNRVENKCANNLRY